MTTEAVSYTHLDVYKRQGTYDEKDHIIREIRDMTRKIRQSNMTDIEAVSYTHLDVYKRQEKQGKTKTVRTGLKLSAFTRKLGIDMRRKIFGEIIEKLGGSLRLIISGAAPLDPAVAKGLNDFGITTIQGYGLTETSPVLSAERPWACLLYTSGYWLSCAA